MVSRGDYGVIGEITLKNSAYDNTEYHVIRNGVDQYAIEELFINQNFGCNIVRYFSTQNLFFQNLGSVLDMKNTFSVIATKR